MSTSTGFAWQLAAVDQDAAEQPLSLRVAEAPLMLQAEPFSTGWTKAVGRSPQVGLVDWDWSAPAPRAAGVAVRPPQAQVFSCWFGAPPPPPAALAGALARPATAKPQRKPTTTSTRLQPPADIVKLEDRLFYLLQPSLEQIVASSRIDFPFDPFPYQLQGIAFLYSRYNAVLADEMGLGKTMQAIATIRLLLYAGELREVLLVCPKPLVTNWQREFSMWAPEIPLAVIEGDPARRRFQWQQPVAVKIANYESLMRERDLFEQEQVRFDLVVLDEAQRIKNRSSATSQVVRSVPRTRSWALTGTPIENSPDDLVGIFEFLSPGYLTPGMGAQHMGRAVGEHVLRRTKDMVLEDLPPKMFRDAELSLLPEQWESYQRAEDEGVVRLQEMDDALTIQHVFELVLRLKQICNFDPLTSASAKLERLQADLEEIAASGQKAIVFSQWVHTLQAIAQRIPDCQPLQYHGRIPSRRRDAVIEQFRDRDEHHVLLMSYGAGSVGLNLQFCQYVFLFDRWWNPAVEDQAINRAHRIGVAGPVTVTRMLMLSTIEERINQVLEEKRQLFDAIFSNAETPGPRGLTQEDVFGLFDLRSPKGPIHSGSRSA